MTIGRQIALLRVLATIFERVIYYEIMNGKALRLKA